MECLKPAHESQVGDAKSAAALHDKVDWPWWVVKRGEVRAPLWVLTRYFAAALTKILDLAESLARHIGKIKVGGHFEE